MGKYLTILAISWQNEFIYRLNFILWRLRNILRLMMTYFLWSGIFVSNNQVFGYSQPQMLTYIFTVLIVSSIVLSSPSSDNIGGEINSGDLSNYLVKPINYLYYWFTRDLSSKLLNLSFSFVEIILLFFLLKPVIQIPSNLITLIGFMLSCILALALNYFVSVCSRLSAFWTPESTWGLSFVILVFVEILSGGIFPLDVLPSPVATALQLTPFPYLLYYPVAILVGKVTGWNLVRILLQSLIWTFVSYKLMNWIWQKGLTIYGAEGR